METPNPSFTFPLMWTVGFSGKRFLSDETKATAAIEEALWFLTEAARKQNARLTAISSLARGGDLLFARACQGTDTGREALPWKCLLPFAAAQFIHYDLQTDAQGTPLPEEEIRRRKSEAEAWRRTSLDEPEVVCPRANPDDDEQRVASYLECGYRTVDEADVMIVLLRENEFIEVRERANAIAEQRKIERPIQAALTGVPATTHSLKAGARSIALYAIAARRPCLLLNADAPTPEYHFANEPKGPDALFVDPIISPLIKKAGQEALPKDRTSLVDLYGPPTPSREKVWELMERLGEMANKHQTHTLREMKRMLTYHFAASAIAAIGATVLAYGHDLKRLQVGILIAAILSLAMAKPLLAGLALWIENLLHRRHLREEWLNARVLAELCRGALSLWPLPIQPLDATDEEDFPKVKRLIRTLRLMRTLDAGAPVAKSIRLGDVKNVSQSETQEEADMRVAIDHYIGGRLKDQVDGYYRKKLPKHEREEAFWRRILHVALVATIITGILFFGHKALDWSSAHFGKAPAESTPPAAEHGAAATAKAEHGAEAGHAGSTLFDHPYTDPWRWVEALIIICPFLASYALGMMTVLDCRRRVRRYPEMIHYLIRLADTLAQCQANPSRLRLIEQAERMMIEEQHEWFSVTRNFSV